MDSASRLVIALTGGIASGKTAVSERLSELGAHVIDADIIAHELVQSGQPLLKRIVDTFGPGILDSRGELDRRAMRSLIFKNSKARGKLESILHPAILNEIERRLVGVSSGLIIVVIPLLAEMPARPRFADRILVVDSKPHLQLQRLVKRDRMPHMDAKAMLNVQADRKTRLAIADDIVTNNTSLQELMDNVDELFKRYEELL